MTRMAQTRNIEDPWSAADWMIRIWLTLVILLVVSRCWSDPPEAFKIIWGVVVFLVIGSGTVFVLLTIWT